MKTAKGYRLLPETHSLIRKVQAILKGDMDNAINTACQSFLENARDKPPAQKSLKELKHPQVYSDLKTNIKKGEKNEKCF